MATFTTPPGRALRLVAYAPSLIALAALLGAVGCSTTGAERATAASQSMESFNLSTAKVNDGIEAALKALKTLVDSSGGDVKTSFDAFSKSVTALDEQANVVRAEAEAMKARGDEYFAGWEAGASSISEERHAELAKAYGAIQEELTLAKEAFSPFLKSLKDVRDYLGLDLSPKGLEGAGPLAEGAEKNGATVKARIEGVLRQVNSVRGMLSASLEEKKE